MCRTLLVLVVVTSAADTAVGDVLKIPTLTKVVPVEHTVTIDKEYPGYAFYLTQGDTKVTAVKLDPKTPLKFKGKSTGPDYALVAVPVGARKKYKTDKEFEEAIAASRVEGSVRAERALFSWILVPVRDKRDTVVTEHKVGKIDEKEGIELIETDPDLKKEGGKKGSPDNTPRGRSVWMAGLAAALAVLLGGFWLVGRTRRKA